MKIGENRPRPSPTAVNERFTDAFPNDVTLDERGGAKVNPGIDSKRDRLVRECLRRINKQGWENATVVSVLTFPLDLNMGYGGHLTMPAKKVGAAFITRVLDTPYIDPQDEGDAKIVPIPVFPSEMAEDLVREYAQTGGVFWYPSDLPLDKYVAPDGTTGLQMLEKAQQAVLTWYEMLYRDGLDEWSREPKHKNITDRMRDAAKELFRLGIVSELPVWTKISKEESPNTNCEACGQQIAKVAKFCPTCHFMFDAAWCKEKMPHIWLEHNTDIVQRFIDEEKAKETVEATAQPIKAKPEAKK